jgi:hypothetical protein
MMRKLVVSSIISTFAFLFVANPANAANPPTITSISTSSGLAAGGTSITLSGSNFLARNEASGSVLKVDGIDIPNYVVNSSGTRVTFTTPAHAVGTVAISACSSAFNCASIQFQYVDYPALTSVTPNSGSTGGGETVEIIGTNFLGTKQVLFGTSSAEFTLISNTKITAKAPGVLAAGEAAVKVITNIGASSVNGSYAYTLNAPSINGITPSTGGISGSNTINISGTNFLTGSTVAIGGNAATVQSITPKLIVARTPRGSAGTVDVVVTTAGGVATSTGGFKYVTAPTISSVSPDFGPASGGYSVTISGTNLLNANSVSIGGVEVSLFTVDSDTQIRASVPSGSSGTTNLVVTTTGGRVSTPFTYSGAPSISNVSSSVISTTAGQSIVITGKNFIGTKIVAIGNINIDAFEVLSNTSIRLITPNLTTGSKNLTVTTGSGSTNFSIKVIGQPSITSIDPSSGTTAGNLAITITGLNLDSATSATVNGKSVSSLKIASASKLTFTLPASTTEGAVIVQIITPVGPLNTTFTYIKAASPIITLVSPNIATALGGTTIKITGNFLSSVNRVTFGGTDGKNLKVMSDSEIAITTPAGSAGSTYLVVYAAGGNARTTFTYASAPSITRIDQNFGKIDGGDQINIYGSGFLAVNSVKIGSSNASIYNILSDSKITLITPPGTAGTTNISITSNFGTASLAFKYESKPTISNLSIKSAPGAIPTNVTLNGSSLATTKSVKFDGVPVTNLKVISDTQISFDTPVMPDGNSVLTLTSNGGLVSIGFIFYEAGTSPSAKVCTPNVFPNIVFAKNSKDLTAKAQEQLIEVVKYVSKNNCATITIGRYAFASYAGKSSVIKSGNSLSIARSSIVGSAIQYLLRVNENATKVKAIDLLNAKSILGVSAKDSNPKYRVVTIKAS